MAHLAIPTAAWHVACTLLVVLRLAAHEEASITILVHEAGVSHHLQRGGSFAATRRERDATL